MTATWKLFPYVTAIFIVCIFWRDVNVVVTLPLAVFFLPILALCGPVRPRFIPSGVYILSGLAVLVAMQAFWGTPPRGKQDLVTYLPIAYAIVTMLALRNIRVSSHLLQSAIIAGGALTAISMLVLPLLLPTGEFMIKCQAFWRTELHTPRRQKRRTK